MKEYKKSDYAINKNRKGIVYKNADGSILEITFEKIAEGNPNFTHEDFLKIKEFSDALYLEQERGDNVYRKHVKGTYDDIKDSKWLATDSFVDELLELLEDESIEKAVYQFMDEKLTPKQRRRFLMYLNGMSTVKIGEIEGCNQNAAWESIEAGKEKIKKFLRNFPKYTGRNGFHLP